MKFYEFIDKAPPIGSLVTIEGTERVFADHALTVLIERLLPSMRDVNLETFAASDWSDAVRVREAVQAMPFLADRRVVVITDVHLLKAQQRRDVLEIAQSVPAGNTLIVSDLLAPRSERPQTIGSLIGRSALRIDTTANDEVRSRFIAAALAELDATAEPRALAALIAGDTDLASLQNDLAKLALAGKKIMHQQLEAELLGTSDPKPYKYASAVVSGKAPEALEIAAEFFAHDPRGAAIPLLSALATECGLVWEMARLGGELPTRFAWREASLRPLARRVGERRARIAYERAVRGVEAIVTGQSGSDPEDHRILVERLSVELSQMSRPIR